MGSGERNSGPVVGFYFLMQLSSQSGLVPSRSNLLITGPPGVGKTTLIRHTLHRLPDLRASGFYTVELRHGGRRVGFEAVTLDGHRQLLSHAEFPSRWRVGRYGVDIAGFEANILPHIDLTQLERVELLVVDEIGKMECFSEAFCQAIRQALDSPIPVLATVPARGTPFIEALKRRQDVVLAPVTPPNRETLIDYLLMLLGPSLGLVA